MSDAKELPRYVSHKQVCALEITGFSMDSMSNSVVLLVKDEGFGPIKIGLDVIARYKPVAGDFYVKYADGYESISPRKAFLDGYKPAAEAKYAGLPVAGYRPQSSEAVALVNANKVGEEHLLRQLDLLKTKDVDQRWLAIARTHIEEGFMALNRAIFKPERVKLPEDQA